jgi:hypothetical protein
VPDFAFVDGTRTGQLLEAGRGLWLDFDARGPARERASRWDGRLTYVAGDVEDRLGLTGVLVRPDGIVAWAGEEGAPIADAEEAARRWFGTH